MAEKFLFQFAGVDPGHSSTVSHRKWLRVGLIAMAGMLTAVAYWGYLHHMMHSRSVVAAHIVPVATAAPVAAKSVAPVAPAVPVVVASPAAPASTLKKVADDSVLAVGNSVGNSLSQVVKTAPAVPVATAVPIEPAAKPVPVAMAAPVPIVAPTVSVARAPVAHRPLRVHTDQERLAMAGETAFGNMMDLANKYPDAYGFQAGDFLSDAKLGEPLPVYTIAESNRAKYQAGQPVKPLLKPAKQWVFPVRMGDRLCCMVLVSHDGHEYVPGKSNKSLAMAWSKILEKWPAEEGYHPLIVVNPDVPGFYFTVPELPQQNMTDIIQMFYYNPSPSPAEVILASWR